ncbi:MAG: cytochrome c biogenesis protein CcsA [Flavobacteriales bacterium]|nr:cytochrome c biogenesis protein CcsA [Flavobacteriales bacterium]
MSIKKLLNIFFGSRASGLYILVFAIAIGVATFIENDFGTSSAQKLVYRSSWFSVLLFLFSGALIQNIFKFRMIQQKKWGLFLFHFSMVIIILGAGITRYFGYEGIMHIREGQSSSKFYSSESYLKFKYTEGEQDYIFTEPVFFSSIGGNNFQKEYLLGNNKLSVELDNLIPNPIEKLEESQAGLPIIQLVIGGNNGRENYYLKAGEKRQIKGSWFTFNAEEIIGGFNLKYERNDLYIKSARDLVQRVMATQKVDTIAGSDVYQPLLLKTLYSSGNLSFVISNFESKGAVIIESEGFKLKNESSMALQFNIDWNDKTFEKTIYGRKGSTGIPIILPLDKGKLEMSYGSKVLNLPFQIALHDFQMERYPGTENAASYASEVQLIDPRENVNEPFRIYMNNILNHDGFRFFQSSFDRDEKGTYLSVNHDFWGTWVSYLGYFLLTLGMVLSLFSKKSRFCFLLQQIKKHQLVLLLLLASPAIYAQEVIQSTTGQINAEHAELFSEVVVQDYRGRMKPVHTLSRQILRKVSRSESYGELNADQVILGMFSDKKYWSEQKLIKLGKHPKLKEQLGTDEKLVAYQDFFNPKGKYKLHEFVREAYAMDQKDRGSYEKELLKLDERLNIVSMVFSGSILKLIPDQNDDNNTWLGAPRHHQHQHEHESLVEKFFNAYKTSLKQGSKTGNFSEANAIILDLKDYQNQNGGSALISQDKIKSEIFLNNLAVFDRLGIIYTFLALGFLILMFIEVFSDKLKLNKAKKISIFLLFLAFLFHLFGLILRWYVSGRAPWSNGYESMIYIAFTSCLAGLFFTRKSFGGLAATCTLSATILMVAKLSYLDPEITPLVPVLRSYWLTIHVSLIAGSYGFLMLGAVIGLINLILYASATQNRLDKIKKNINHLSMISEVTLIGGLFMISVGTYLGGVWANESWGRYWGWDAKETWALVTILVYAFILHMRIIPKLHSLFRYNVATIFGLASVIMTYYGVNYYLSGLHSYAAGDPMPVPNWVYISVGVIVLIVILASIKKRKFQLK